MCNDCNPSSPPQKRYCTKLNRTHKTFTLFANLSGLKLLKKIGLKKYHRQGAEVSTLGKICSSLYDLKHWLLDPARANCHESYSFNFSLLTFLRSFWYSLRITLMTQKSLPNVWSHIRDAVHKLLKHSDFLGHLNHSQSPSRNCSHQDRIRQSFYASKAPCFKLSCHGTNVFIATLLFPGLIPIGSFDTVMFQLIGITSSIPWCIAFVVVSTWIFKEMTWCEKFRIQICLENLNKRCNAPVAHFDFHVFPCHICIFHQCTIKSLKICKFGPSQTLQLVDTAKGN